MYTRAHMYRFVSILSINGTLAFSHRLCALVAIFRGFFRLLSACILNLMNFNEFLRFFTVVSAMGDQNVWRFGQNKNDYGKKASTHFESIKWSRTK